MSSKRQARGDYVIFECKNWKHLDWKKLIHSDNQMEQLTRAFRIWEHAESESSKEPEMKLAQITLPARLLDMIDEECTQRAVPRQTLLRLIIFSWVQDQIERRTRFHEWLNLQEQATASGFRDYFEMLEEQKRVGDSETQEEEKLPEKQPRRSAPKKSNVRSAAKS